MCYRFRQKCILYMLVSGGLTKHSMKGSSATDMLARLINYPIMSYACINPRTVETPDCHI
jgi:hypothetical protein